MEIERKFLLIPKTDLNYLEIVKRYRIKQYYISINPEIRLREKKSFECNKKKVGFNCVEKHYLTIKSNGDKVRREIEVNINKNIFEENFDKIVGKMISKTRYEILHDNFIFEVDEYDNSLERTVEVEFKTEEESSSFTPPFWFGEEVTYNPIFKNKNIAIGMNKFI